MFKQTLPADAQTALAILGQAKILPDNTYLAGGSALALSLGHRISVDFDFFTPESFDQKDLTTKLKKIGDFTEERQAPDTLLGNFNNVHFSIFKYDHSLLFPLHDFCGIKVADPKDIGAMKLAAIMTRATKKDYIDLYFLDKNGISLDSCLDYYEQKYHILEGTLYSIMLSLSYFDDAETSEMPRMLQKINWKNVKTFLSHESIRLGKKFLGQKT